VTEGARALHFNSRIVHHALTSGTNKSLKRDNEGEMNLTSARSSWIVFVTNLYARRSSVFSSLPTPEDSPVVRIDGPDPDKVLILGSGIVIGTGVTSHELALGGHLARLVAAATGRGIQVEVLPIPGLMVSFVHSYLSRLDLARFDVVVLAVGLNDALMFTPVRAWSRRMADALSIATNKLAVDGHICIVAVADPSQSPLFHRFPARLAAHHARVLNRATASIINGRPDASLIHYRITPVTDPVRLYDSSSYRGWAGEIAPRIIQILERSR
jgi:hypothetical protein